MAGNRPTDTQPMLEARQKAFAILAEWVRAAAVSTAIEVSADGSLS